MMTHPTESLLSHDDGRLLQRYSIGGNSYGHGHCDGRRRLLLRLGRRLAPACASGTVNVCFYDTTRRVRRRVRHNATIRVTMEIIGMSRCTMHARADRPLNDSGSSSKKYYSDGDANENGRDTQQRACGYRSTLCLRGLRNTTPDAGHYHFLGQTTRNWSHHHYRCCCCEPLLLLLPPPP